MKNKEQLLPITASSKKKLRAYATLDYITEYGPVSGGLIAAIIKNPHTLSWLIFIILGVGAVGLLVYMFSKHTKTIIWGLILLLILCLSGTMMIVIVASCFACALVNDLIFAPLHTKAKKEFESNYSMEKFSKQNGLIK